MCVGGCVHVLHAHTYVFPSASLCVGLFFFFLEGGENRQPRILTGGAPP